MSLELKKGRLDETKLRALEASADAKLTSEPIAKTAPKRGPGRPPKSLTERLGSNDAPLNVRINVETLARLKTASFETGEPMREIVQRALRNELS